MKNERGKNILLGVLIVGLVSMTVAFAALSTRLDISGTAEVKGGTWGVRFESSDIEPDTVVTNLAGKDANNASISTTQDSIGGSFVGDITLADTSIQGVKVAFTKPGVEAIYYFKIHNTGTIDAKISSFTTTPLAFEGKGDAATADAAMVEAKVTYYVEYTTSLDSENWQPIAVGQTLDAGQTINARLRLVYADDNQIPSNDVTITGLDRTIIYSQN